MGRHIVGGLMHSYPLVNLLLFTELQITFTIAEKSARLRSNMKYSTFYRVLLR